MRCLDITGDQFHPEWNYAIRPRQSPKWQSPKWQQLLFEVSLVFKTPCADQPFRTAPVGATPGFQVAPQGDQKLACYGNDGDALDAALAGPDTLAKPDAQRTVGVVTQPQPGQLDHDGAGLGIASFADALIAADRTALEMARRQSDIAPKLLAIVELPVKDLADQCRANLRLDLMRSWIFF